jgi:hypothetical protein
MKKNLVLILAILMLLLTNHLFATSQSAIQSRPLGGFHGDFQRRPDFAAGSNVIGSAGTSGKGSMGIGSGLSIMNFKQPSRTTLPDKDIMVIPFSFSYGLTDKIDLSVAVPLMRQDIDGHGEEYGYANLMLGSNFHYLGFSDDSIKSQLSLSAIFPTGQDKITSTFHTTAGSFEIDNKSDLIISNYVSKKFGTNMQFDFALSYLMLGAADDDVINYGLSLSKGWSQNYSNSIEISGSDTKDSIAGKNNYNIYFGNRLSIPKFNVNLGLIYGTSVFSTYLKHTITTSLSYSF